jgi:hypothetical protein
MERTRKGVGHQEDFVPEPLNDRTERKQNTKTPKSQEAPKSEPELRWTPVPLIQSMSEGLGLPCTAEKVTRHGHAQLTRPAVFS